MMLEDDNDVSAEHAASDLEDGKYERFQLWKPENTTKMKEG